MRSWLGEKWDIDTVTPTHIKARPVRAAYDTFHEIEWDVVISWKLRGLCGCYGVYGVVMGSMSRSFRGNRLSWLVRDRFT